MFGNTRPPLNHRSKDAMKFFEKQNLSLLKDKEAAQRNKKKPHFIANLSSHLRLPLNQLVQFSNIALQRLRRKQTQLVSDYLVEIKWISEELIIYVNDLLEISQLKTGESEFSLEEIDILYFLEKMKRQFQPIADSRKISFLFSSNIKNSHVRADYTKLAKVLNILLKNAFRHVQDKKGNIEVYTEQTQEENIHITISDNGSNTAIKQQSYLFNAYEENCFQDGIKDNELMDFSLSICKELMLGQNGDIHLDDNSDENKTRFILSLPIAQSLLD